MKKLCGFLKFGLPLLLMWGVFAFSVHAADEYLVIDISEGDNEDYPVTYYDTLPAAVTDDAYKTTNIVLKLIRAGTFMMGSPVSETGRDDDEDLHQVTLTQDFYMGVFEITEFQWSKIKFYETWTKEPAVNTYVTMEHIKENKQSFIKKLSRGVSLNDLEVDLPTEAQWEYACRAGTDTAYSFGSDVTDLRDYAWYEDYDNSLHEVGTKNPNPWGLYDMHGNAAEFCQDAYNSNLGTNAVTDPLYDESGTEDYDESGTKKYVEKSGVYNKSASDNRSAYRHSVDKGGSNTTGFRICVAPPPPPPTYELTVVSGSGGGSYTNGHVQQIIADAPPAWYEFDQWTGTVADASAPTTTVTIGTADITVGATYKACTYDISVSNGTASASVATNAQVVTIYADPPATETNVFYRWEGDVATVADISAMTTTVTVAGDDVTLTAVYRDAPYYLTVNNGTGAGYHFEGEVVSITATAPEALHTFWWDGDNTSVADPEAWNTTLIMPGADITITATYPDIKYTLTVVNGYGSGSYVDGTEVNVSPKTPPSDMHVFDQWSGDTPGLQSFLTEATVFTIDGADALIEPHYKPVAAVQGDYMVVDLTGSPYEITYMDAPPAGGWNNDYKDYLMPFRRVLSGTYMMGAGTVDNEDEHQVTLTEAFYIGVFEVTQGQWKKVKGSYPLAGYTDSNRAYHPVENVTFDEIRGNYFDGYNWPMDDNVASNSFLGVMRRETGSDGFNLPTEAQWEYACRAGSTGDFYGDPLESIAVYSWNSDEHTAEVGSMIPNAWGLYDTLGNVFEWTLDWFRGHGLGTEAQIDPVGPDEPDKTGPLNNWYSRVIRGGAYISLNYGTFQPLKTATRGVQMTTTNQTFTGFRLIKNVGVPHTLTIVGGKVNNGGPFCYPYRARIAISAEEPAGQNQIFDYWKVEPEGVFAGPLFDASSRDTIISMPADDIIVSAQYK
ncbi:MAG: SUMF1/EgtB/PvdO family nonheme iron enzyme [Kiritimatiellia bacterium]